jgi:hypothetical protein
MREHILAAKANGVLAGRPLPEDEGRSVGASWSWERTSPTGIHHVVRIERSHAQDLDISFAVESPFALDPPPLADFALLTAIFPAMQHGGHLNVAGEVSGLLLRNMLDVQSIWIRMRPDEFRPVSVSADSVREDFVSPHPRRAILPLSAGLDSMYSLFRHTDPARPLGPAAADLEAALFIDGVIAFASGLWSSAALKEKVRECAALRDLPVVVVRTNWEDHVDTYYSHGAMLSACITVLSSHFGLGLVGAAPAHAFLEYPVFGSAACVDVFYGSAGTEIRSDGADLTREQKAAALTAYPEALEHIYVCIARRRRIRNCGRCEKCVRTMLSFIASGSEIPPAFPSGIDLTRIGKRFRAYMVLNWAAHTSWCGQEMGVHHPALRTLRRKYIARSIDYALRSAITRCLPWVDLMQRDPDYPRWLVLRRARRRLDAARAARARVPAGAG